MYRHYLPFILLTLSACGGSGSGGSSAATSSTPIEQLRSESERLAASIEPLGPTPGANVPTSGSANYDGIAAFGFLADSSLGEGVGGDMSINVDFADDEVSGTIDNFYSREGDAREGRLNLSDGELLRASDGALLVANVSGTLEIVSEVRDLDGAMIGTFVGSNAGYVTGVMGLTDEVTLPGGGPTVALEIEGAFALEQR